MTLRRAAYVQERAPSIALRSLVRLHTPLLPEPKAARPRTKRLLRPQDVEQDVAPLRRRPRLRPRDLRKLRLRGGAVDANSATTQRLCAVLLACEVELDRGVRWIPLE